MGAPTFGLRPGDPGTRSTTGTGATPSRIVTRTSGGSTGPSSSTFGQSGGGAGGGGGGLSNARILRNPKFAQSAAIPAGSAAPAGGSGARTVGGGGGAGTPKQPTAAVPTPKATGGGTGSITDLATGTKITAKQVAEEGQVSVTEQLRRKRAGLGGGSGFGGLNF